MRQLHFPAREDITLTAVMFALSDPIRLSIVKCLASTGEQACGSFDVPAAKSTMSHHFKVLRESGVIYMRPEGTSYRNSLRREDLDSRFPGLLDMILNATEPL
jgi:DNA-binding transcriptional ArsR family regulator